MPPSAGVHNRRSGRGRPRHVVAPGSELSVAHTSPIAGRRVAPGTRPPAVTADRRMRPGSAGRPVLAALLTAGRAQPIRRPRFRAGALRPASCFMRARAIPTRARRNQLSGRTTGAPCSPWCLGTGANGALTPQSPPGHVPGFGPKNGQAKVLQLHSACGSAI